MLSSAIALLDAWNESTGARGTLRLHLPPEAQAEAPPAGPGDVWLGLSFDFSNEAEAQRASNLLQTVCSAYRETSKAGHVEVDRYDAVLVVWMTGDSEATLRQLIDGLTTRLHSFE